MLAQAHPTVKYRVARGHTPARAPRSHSARTTEQPRERRGQGVYAAAAACALLLVLTHERYGKQLAVPRAAAELIPHCLEALTQGTVPVLP